MDLWGRVRTAVAGAKQNARALNAEQDAARLSLVGTLTKTVWLARGLQDQARLAQENADAAKRYAQLTEIREQIGASSKMMWPLQEQQQLNHRKSRSSQNKQGINPCARLKS